MFGDFRDSFCWICWVAAAGPGGCVHFGIHPEMDTRGAGRLPRAGKPNVVGGVSYIRTGADAADFGIKLVCSNLIPRRPATQQIQQNLQNHYERKRYLEADIIGEDIECVAELLELLGPLIAAYAPPEVVGE